MKINVVGSSGSGKSTLSRALADALGVTYIQLDQLFWRANWQGTPDEEFFPKLEAALADHSEGWVLDGNFNRTREIKWREADMIVWLDYGFWRIFRQSLHRAISRIISQEELWPGTGNRESFRQTFMSRDSILVWMLMNWRSNRQRYVASMLDARYRHLRIVRLTHPKETEALVASLVQYQDH
ncbi:adenylate kinase [Halomonas dongshanensis]|uniref:Adenylate kinase n=1 Tax=Halomonas dongshanensis TaxID=2890835 RepID=A0ABT2ECD0_9GAMM|nr:adenylate kinase [Halomonas dongshanensis]MCS2608765.1 adenylate kinase [Halomonas dongshanensis]